MKETYVSEVNAHIFVENYDPGQQNHQLQAMVVGEDDNDDEEDDEDLIQAIAAEDDDKQQKIAGNQEENGFDYDPHLSPLCIPTDEINDILLALNIAYEHLISSSVPTTMKRCLTTIC